MESLLLQLSGSSQSSDIVPQLVGWMVFVLILWGLASAVSKKWHYDETKREFQNDPTSRQKRDQFLEAAAARTSEYDHRFIMETIGTLDQARDRQAQSTGLIDELERLSDLHEKGSLTDEEFALAKDKLLRKE